MKRIMMVLIVLLSLMVSAHGEYYPRTGFVTELDHDRDCVIATDWAGLDWEFFGIEDWMQDDIVSMMMDDNGTPDNIYDDIIVKAYYGGSI